MGTAAHALCRCVVPAAQSISSERQYLNGRGCACRRRRELCLPISNRLGEQDHMTRFAELRKNLAEQPWELWTRQVAAILRMDLRKNFLSRRGIWIYLLAFAPVFLIALHAMIDRSEMNSGATAMHNDTEILAGIFQFFYLRFAIFFVCL